MPMLKRSENPKTVGLPGVTSHLHEVGVGELRILCRSSVVGRSMVVERIVVCWGLMKFLGNFFIKLLLASDINVRYHVLSVLFIEETKKNVDIRVFSHGSLDRCLACWSRGSRDVQLCVAP